MNDTAEREFPPGIVCPRCRGTRWEVYRTSSAPNVIRRVRRCLGCGKQVATCEVIERKPRPAAGDEAAA